MGFPTANILNTEKSLERGVMQVSIENFLPIGFEIVTTDNLTQAKKRSQGKINKGSEAAEAMLEMLKIRQ